MPHVATVTIDHTQVDADLTDYVVFVDLSDLPSSFWDVVADGGGDIRCYKNDDTTQLPREVVSCVHSTDTGETHLKYTGTLSASVDTVIHIYADGASAEPAVTDTYGRNAVWTDYEFVLHLRESGNGTTGEYVDSTGNGVTGRGGAGTSTRAPTQTTVDHPWGGTWQDFDGTDDFIQIENSANILDSSYITVTALCLPDTNKTDDNGIVSNRDISQGNNYFQITDRSIGALAALHDGTGENNYRNGSALSTASPSWVALTSSASALNFYINGSLAGSDTTIAGDNQFVTAKDMRVGVYYDLTAAARHFNGKIGEVRGRLETLSEWLSTEHNNQSSSSTFYAATAAGGAALEGAATAQSTATGALTTSIPLAGAALGVTTAAAALSTSIPLTGAATVTSNANGSLTATIKLAGSAIAQAVAAADLTALINLTGAAAGESSATGDLSTGVNLSGAASAESTAAADLTIQIRLNGAAIAEALAAGDLTTGAGNDLSGDASAVSTAAGALTTAIPLQGAALSTSSGTGDLSTIIPLAGAAASVSSAIGTLDTTITLTGAAIAEALAGGDLTARITFDGAAVAQASATGDLTTGEFVSAPADRILALPSDARVLYLPDDDRALAMLDDDRTLRLTA